MQKPIPGPGTVVGANVRLQGVIKDVNDIAVHGHVDGEVISEKNVLVGETATVKGPVTGEVVTISGTVRGSVAALNKLELLPTAKVIGSITTKDLIIRSGALFNGKAAMTRDGEEKESEKGEKEESKEEPKEETKKGEERAGEEGALEYEREA